MARQLETSRRAVYLWLRHGYQDRWQKAKYSASPRPSQTAVVAEKAAAIATHRKVPTENSQLTSKCSVFLSRSMSCSKGRGREK